MTTPAESFSVGEFIQDELDARGWTTTDLAKAMGGDFIVTLFILDMWIAITDSKHESKVIMEDDGFLNRLAWVFGTSTELWHNMHTARIDWLKARKR